MIKRDTGVRRSPVRRAADGFAQILALLAVSCIVVIVALTVADVARRALSGRSVAGVTEMSEVAMVLIVFLSLAFAEMRGSHVAMTLVQRRLKPTGAAVLNAVGMALMITIVTWMLFVTADRALLSVAEQEFRFGLVRIPVWPARVAIAVGLAAYLFQLLFRFADDIKVAVGRGRAVTPPVSAEEPPSRSHDISGV